MKIDQNFKAVSISSFLDNHPSDAARLASYQESLKERGMGLSSAEATDFMGIVLAMGQNGQIIPEDIAQLRLNGIMLAVKHNLHTNEDPLYEAFLDAIAAADIGAAAPMTCHVTHAEKLALAA